MPKHRELNFRRFVAAVTPELLTEYVQSLEPEKRPEGWTVLNGDVFQKWLDEPDNAELKGLVEQDFRRINDVCDRGMDVLVDVYQWYEIPLPQDASNEQLALQLFVDQKDAWGHAWSRYLLHSVGSKADHYLLPAQDFDVNEASRDEFQRRTRGLLAERARGNLANVHLYQDGGSLVLYIERSERVRVTARWRGEVVAFESYRPAMEDVMAFDASTGHLQVKASRQDDRSNYVRLFAGCFMGDEAIGENALKSPAFDLEPSRSGRFSFQGDSAIKKVALIGLKLKMPKPRAASVEVRGGDALATLRDLGISIRAGDLVAVRLRFDFPSKVPPRSVSFGIDPPSKTDLPDTRLSGAINAYLRDQKVKLW